MRKTGLFKKFAAFIILAAMTVTPAGCGNDKSGSNNSKISIKDIEWNVKESIADGNRIITSYGKNHSKFPLVFEITFCLKKDVSAEEMESFYSYLKKSYGIYDSDEDSDELLEEIINEESVNISTEFILEPGDTFDLLVDCYGSFFTDMSYYNLFEPDIMGIRYISDNTIYTVYYDFKNNEYTQDEETAVAYDWTEYEIGNKIPRLEAAFLQKDHETEINFECSAQFISEETYNNYIEDCKAMGYTIDEYTYDSEWYGTKNFSARNNDGYYIDLEFNPYYHNMEIKVLAP